MIKEGSLSFDFEAPAEKYDEWSFYRNQFLHGCSRDNKGVDMLCYSSKDAWLIEVKDYRQDCQTSVVKLADEIALKVRDSLAGLVAAQIRANQDKEKQFARKILQAQNIKIVCHIEQPAKVSRLRPRAIDPKDLKDKLRRLLKAIDPHPLVMDAATVPPSVPWQVNRGN